MKQLDYFFKPKTVAIIGASRHPKKIGHVIFRNFAERDFQGKVFPINPNADKIFDVKCYPSVLKVKEKIDLAIISVPAPIVPKILDECGRKRVRAVVIISGGFAEVGNKELEEDCLRIIKRYRMRAIGPNCLGVFDPYSGVDTIFNPAYKLERPKPGNISFISQSGATMSIILDWMSMKGYRACKFVSYGNASDVDEGDLISYLVEDPETKVICVYFEGVDEGRRFYEISRRNSKKTPIVVLKGGITEAGGKAVSSHTGSLAGSAEVYKAAFKQAGLIEAEDLEQIFDFARVLSTQPLPQGNRVQIITDGGGFGVLMSDYLIKNGLQIAEMSKKSLDKVRKVVPPHVNLENIIDLTGDATSNMYGTAIDAAMKDENVDMIAAIVLFQPPLLTGDVVEVITDACKRSKKPIIVVSAGGRYTEVLKKSLEDFGIPCFSYPERAASTLRALHEYGKNFNEKTKLP
jgi:acetyl coenzyme A synthetase (ADP forming)-like protein